MAEIATLARPYAEAAFRLARERRALPAWSEALGRLAQIAVDPQAASLIGNPNIPAVKVESLFRAAAGKEAESASELGNFIRLLADNGRLACLPEIAGQFAAMKQGAYDYLTKPFKIDDEREHGRLRPFSVESWRTIVEQRIDGEVVSEATVKVVIGDQVLDASVSGKLSAMRVALNS